MPLIFMNKLKTNDADDTDSGCMGHSSPYNSLFSLVCSIATDARMPNQ